jgi:hypothetical protein
MRVSRNGMKIPDLGIALLALIPMEFVRALVIAILGDRSSTIAALATR